MARTLWIGWFHFFELLKRRLFVAPPHAGGDDAGCPTLCTNSITAVAPASRQAATLRFIIGLPRISDPNFRVALPQQWLRALVCVQQAVILACVDYTGLCRCDARPSTGPLTNPPKRR